MKNLVLFKGHVGGITVVLDEEAAFEEILKQFEEKLESSKKFFKGVSTNLHIKGRLLEQKEEEQLIQLLANQSIVDVAFVQLSTSKSEEQEVEVQEKPVEKVKASISIKDVLGGYQSDTYFYYGVVRSGQHLAYEGSVVVLGDVNPGAIVSAGHNIIVLGALKGIVYAGKALEDKKCFVVACKMKPVQISIGSLTAQAPEEERRRYSKKNEPAQIAYVSEGQIYVEEIDYKILNHMLK